MKKNLLLTIFALCSLFSYSQAVTSLTIAPFLNLEVTVSSLPVDTGIAFIANVLPDSAADKTVKFTIDSGDACYFDIDTTPGKLTCTKEGKVRIKAEAQDGSSVTTARTFTVKTTTKVNSLRLYFNNGNINNVLSDEHFKDPVVHPGEAPKIYQFSIDSNALRIDIDKIGPESAPKSGMPTNTWKTFSYGFSPVVLRIMPSMGVSLDMSQYKNIRIKMRGSNTRGHVNTTPGSFHAPDFNFMMSLCSKKINPNGPSKIITADTVNSTRHLLNYNGTTGNNLYDSSDVRFLWIKFNSGKSYDLVAAHAQTEVCKANDFKGSVWIEWIAFGMAADTVLTESITIAGEDSLLFVSKAQKFTYTASVLPLDASDKTYFWSTDDPTIASIDGSGKLSILKVGTVKVIASAQDGSGIIGEKSVKCYYALGDKPLYSTDYAVYPNPAEDVINISGTSDLDKAELINLDGKVVKIAVSNKVDVLTINVSDLAGGVYILKCYADNGEVIVKKVVVE